jgi:hypothetical protein
MLLSSDPGYLGHFILEQRKADRSLETINIDADVNKTYNETVIDVDENTQWEQEKMHFSVLMEKDKREIDIRFISEIFSFLTCISKKILFYLRLTIKLKIVNQIIFI